MDWEFESVAGAQFEAHRKQDPGSLVWTQRDTTLEKVYKAPSLSSCLVSSPFMSERLNTRAWSAGACGAVFVLVVTDDVLSPWRGRLFRSRVAISCGYPEILLSPWRGRAGGHVSEGHIRRPHVRWDVRPQGSDRRDHVGHRALTKACMDFAWSVWAGTFDDFEKLCKRDLQNPNRALA